MKDSENYTVVVSLPRPIQVKLHNEKAKRQLAGKKQTVAEIASELLASKVEELEMVG